jgi:hypothetical protein
MPGPPPKEGARNPNNGKLPEGFAASAQRLPRSGRKGRAPKWPLPDPATPAEAHAWRYVWKLPQAVAWERLKAERTVARYCIVLAASEERGASGAILAEVRQMEDRLGLSPMALLRLRWSIVDDELLEAEKARKTPAGGSTRSRLRVVS